jgi:hypothetical protein
MKLHARTSQKALWVTLVLPVIQMGKLFSIFIFKKWIKEISLSTFMSGVALLIILSSRLTYPIRCSLVMNVSFRAFIFHQRHQHCLWTVHNCHYAYISFTCLHHCCEVTCSLTQNITSHSHLFCYSKSSDTTFLLVLTVLQKLFFSHFYHIVE